MSDSKQGGNEPSMEEILASIRKIISEDTADAGSKTADRDADAAAAPDAGQAESDAAQAEDDASGEAPESQGDDVLELSEEAEGDAAPADAAPDDDAPLDLTEEAAAQDVEAGPDAGDEPLELDEQVDGDGETALDAHHASDSADESLAAGTDVADADAVDAASADDIDDVAPDAGTQPAGEPAPLEADETPFLADPFDDSAAGAAAPDTAAEAALAAGAMADGGEAQADDGSHDTRSDDTASPLGPEDQRVISETAEQQAVEQLTSLARQAEGATNDTAADNVDHILARMVRDALRPQLREWMDRNLPQIVERIVREEVQRMTKRAQGLDDDGRY